MHHCGEILRADLDVLGRIQLKLQMSSLTSLNEIPRNLFPELDGTDSIPHGCLRLDMLTSVSYVNIQLHSAILHTTWRIWFTLWCFDDSISCDRSIRKTTASRVCWTKISVCFANKALIFNPHLPNIDIQRVICFRVILIRRDLQTFKTSALYFSLANTTLSRR